MPDTRVASPRAFVVGCGRIAGGYNDADETHVLTHVVAYRRLGAPIAGCCDRDGAVARAFAERWGVPVHGADLDSLLRETAPEVVSICVPPEASVPILERVLDAPTVRAVLLEKPLGSGPDDTRAVERLVAASATPVLVNYCRAFDPFYQRIQRDCCAGVHGPLRQVVGRYYGSARVNASHLMERVIAMAGRPAGAVRLSGPGNAPIFEMTFEGTPATALFLPTPGCEYAAFEFDLLFERARMRIIDSERRLERFVSRADDHFQGFFNLVPCEDRSAGAPSHEGMLHAVDAALAAAAGRAVGDDIFGRSVMVERVLDRIGAC